MLVVTHFVFYSLASYPYRLCFTLNHSKSYVCVIPLWFLGLLEFCESCRANWKGFGNNVQYKDLQLLMCIIFSVLYNRINPTCLSRLLEISRWFECGGIYKDSWVIMPRSLWSFFFFSPRVMYDHSGIKTCLRKSRGAICWSYLTVFWRS